MPCPRSTSEAEFHQVSHGFRSGGNPGIADLSGKFFFVSIVCGHRSLLFANWRGRLRAGDRRDGSVKYEGGICGRAKGIPAHVLGAR